MSAVLLLFVFLSLRDYWKLKQGKTNEVALAMPESLKKACPKSSCVRAAWQGFGFLGALTLGVVLESC
jgi:hypothetical protein